MRHARGRPSWGRSTALLASSSAVAHAVLFAGTLVTTRLYAPSELGAGAAFLAVVGVVSVASALRYDFALPVARDDEVPALTALCLVLVASTAATLGAIAIAFGPAAIDALDAPGHLAPLRFAVFPALLVMGLATVLYQWATRNRRYALLARVRLVQTGTQVAAQAGLGAAGAGAGGIVAGALGGSCAGLASLCREPLAGLRAARRALDRGSVRAVASRYRSFPTLSLATAVAQGIAVGCVPLLLGVLYGLEVAGWYVLAQRVVSAPLGILGEAAARTFFGDAALLMRTDADGVRPRLRRTVAALGAAAVIPTIVVVAAGPALFATVFGDDWRAAGDLARPLCALAAAQLVAVPVMQTLLVFSRLGLQTALALLRLVATIGPLVLAHATGASPLGALTAMSIGGALGYLLSLLISDRVAGGASRDGSPPPSVREADRREVVVGRTACDVGSRSAGDRVV